jgi:divalent metal cation (Fe/Co/Zn/Cd) transporter
VGVLIAMAAIGLSVVTGDPSWDAIGSILIGILLGVVALWLIERNLKLLTGPSIPANDEARVRAVLKASPLIENVQRMRTQAIDTQTFALELDVRFSSQAICDALSEPVRADFPQVAAVDSFERFQLDYTNRVLETVGQEIDRIESKLAEEDEAFRFVDIEIQNTKE